MSNFKFLIGFLTLISLISSCEKGSIMSESPNSEVLNNLFSEYQIVKIANNELLALSKNRKEEGFILDLKIPQKPSWSFSVQFHNFYDDDYQSYEDDANGNWVEVISSNRSDAFHGLSLDKKSRAMFIMEDNQFSGEIYEGDIQYGLEPLTDFVAGASPKQYVYYRLDADIAGNQLQCDNSNVSQIKDDQPGIDLRDDSCREMSITYVADYEYYKKFDKNSTDTRAYVETSTSNKPATSSDKSTFLSEWKSWGRDGNIGQADANLLFTGRYFEGLYGKAYKRVVCRTYNGLKKAYGVITKQSAINGSTYSKVTAHEIGHMLGAEHTSTGFMKTGNHKNRSMPQVTRNELNNYISDNNSCMRNRTCVDYDKD